jgi:hypothetical protein
MKMSADMKFENDVWRTLTSAQQDSMKALRKAKKPRNPSRAAHNSERKLLPEPSLPPTNVTPAPVDPGQSIRSVLSTATARPSPSISPPSQISHLGRTHTLINACIRYQSHSTQTSPVVSSLIDSGANGGLSGSDVRVLDSSLGSADITGAPSLPSS